MLLSMTMFSACSTEVDLCYEENHPHLTAVKYEFNWGGTADERIPDSMYVIAYRVVNLWKASMVVDSHNGCGHFIHNAPDLTEETPGQTEDVSGQAEGEIQPEKISRSYGTTLLADDSSTDNGSSDNEDETSPLPDAVGPSLDVFPVRTGAYKFITFSLDNDEMIYTDVTEYMVDETNEKHLQDIYVEYKVYPKGSNGLRHTLVDWQDYNAYASYIQPNMRPIYFDTIPSKQIPKGSTVECGLSPKPVTQHIDIYFNIKKDRSRQDFRIDSVWADISGVPRRFNLANGYLDVTRTAKMMFPTDDVKDSDTSNGPVKVHGAIDVPGIVQNNTPTANTGPGIMQVIIFASVLAKDEQGNQLYEEVDGLSVPKRLTKKIQGKINLYNTLRTSKLLTLTDDMKHAVLSGSRGVIDIVADIVIDGEDVLEYNDELGGIDGWKKGNNDFIVDI